MIAMRGNGPVVHIGYKKELLQNEIFCNSPHKNLFTLDDEKLPFCPFLRLFMHDQRAQTAGLKQRL